MKASFLTAEWRKLAMANYAVDPALLKNYLPRHTEIDLWNNTCYVSLVGFMFVNTKLKGLSIPFHSKFEEVNLRFYVRYKEGHEWRRGVVFIKEIVPRHALTWVANMMYNEKYETMKMTHSLIRKHDRMEVAYSWKKGTWHSFGVTSELNTTKIKEGSEEEFITEHYWGYTFINNIKTSEYGVEHPRWDVYPVMDYTIHVDFGLLYGNGFSILQTTVPSSVFLAEGSEIIVREGRSVYS